MSFKLKASIICLICLITWLVIAPVMARNLVVEKPLKKADAILVLAGSKAYVERTRKAAEIYKEGVSSKVFLTDDGEIAGWSQEEERNPPFVYLAKQELLKQGVPEENIEIFKPIGSGTIYEAQLFEKINKTRKLKSLLLVTSPYHTNRTLWTFEKKVSSVGIEYGIVSPKVNRRTPSSLFWWLSPRGWRVVGGEYAKFAVYWLYY